MSVPPHSIDRRHFLSLSSAAIAAAHLRRDQDPSPRAPRPVPSPWQLAWQRDELALFLHFGVNTFTDREWGDGTEDPAIFAPAALDARQWARSAREAGFKTLILTAKHHDGFCLWPSRVTRHTVAQSPFRAGQGDVVREFVDACAAEGLKAGLYCSPWDRNAPVYGESDRYNTFYLDQLTELLSQYGKIHEVWFDGANGEGPTGRKQRYDWPRFFGLVRRLQPEAVIFSDAGPDVRWIGNEKGEAGDPNWSTVDPSRVPFPGADGPDIIDALLHGDPNGPVWRPGETDTSIRPGWFFHPSENDKVRPVDELMALYFSSVGRNSKLLLNVPPNREGLLHSTDVARLSEFRRQRDKRFATDLAAGRPVAWHPVSPTRAIQQVELNEVVGVSVVDLRESIERGQRVARYLVEGSDGGAWRPLSRGTTIGCRKLDLVEPMRVRRVRVTIDTIDRPLQVAIGLFGGAGT